MSSRDPWAHVPNLSGLTAGEGEDTRTADPSRLYPAMRGGVVDSVTGRINDVPRAKMYYNAGNPSYGGGSSFLPFDTIVYDNDNLCAGGTYFTCKTPGIYFAKGRVRIGGVAGGNVGCWVQLTNPTQSILYGEATQYDQPTVFGCYMDVSGLWDAKIGDRIGLWVYTAATCSISGGQVGNSLECCLLSSYGSDQQ